MRRAPLRSDRPHASARPRPNRARPRLTLERLEDRRLLASFNWVSNADGVFNVAANWRDQANNPGVPGPNDDANIPQSGITVTSSASIAVNSLNCNARLSITGGTFTIGGVVANSSINQLVLPGGTIFKVNAGAASITNGGAFAGTFNSAAGANLRFTGGTDAVNAGTTFAGAGLVSVAGGTMSLNVNTTAPANFAVESGTVNGVGILTTPGTFNWTGGALDGPGSTLVPTGATLNLSGAGFKYLTGSHVLNLAGTTTWTGTGEFDGSPGSKINNTGTFTIQNDANFANGAAGAGVIFNNGGTLTKAAGVGTTSFASNSLNNSGIVNINSGSLSLNPGSLVETETGTFNVAAGSLVSLVNGSTVLNAGSALNGAGTYGLEAGTLTANVNVAPANLTIDGGTLNGPATVTVSAAMNWTGGDLDGPGATYVPAGGGLAISGGTVKYLTGSHVLNLAGTATWTGTGEFDGSPGSKINNTGAFAIQSDTNFSNGAAGAGMIFNNGGTLTKAAGVGTTTFASNSLNNTGIVSVQSGSLVLTGGGADTGTFNVSSGALLNFNGGTHTLNGNAVNFAGSGIVALSSGALAAGPAGASFTVAPTTVFQWNGGAIGVPTGVTLVSHGTLALIGTGDQVLNGGGTLQVVGTINQSGLGSLRIDGSGSTATTLNLPSGSTYNFQADSGIHQGGGGGGIVTNSGTIVKSSGVGISDITTVFNNVTIINVNVGTVRLGTAGGANFGGFFNIAGGAVLDLTGGSTVTYSGTYTGSGAGQIQLNGGTLRIAGGSAGATLNFPAGLFRWNGGTVDTAGSTLTIPATGRVQLTNVNTVDLTGGGTLLSSGLISDTGFGNLRISNATTLANNGLYDLQTDAGIIDGGNGSLIVNTGTLRKTGGTSASTISPALSNTGKVEARSGTLSIVGPVSQVLGTTLTGGSWAAYGTSTVAATLQLLSVPALTTIGLAATAILDGPNSAFTNLSALTTNQGVFALLDGQSFATSGNFLNTNGLFLGAGDTLAVAGNFAQSSTGTLMTQFGGTSGAPSFGGITAGAGGTVTLDGTLTLNPSVTPAVGAVLRILDKPSTGAISGVFAGLPEGSTVVVGGATYKISYLGGTGNDVTLTRIS